MPQLDRRGLPADARYPSLQTGINRCHVARPEYVRMVRSARDAEHARPERRLPAPSAYCKDSYKRLRAVKRRYDPTDVLRHSLSITP